VSAGTTAGRFVTFEGIEGSGKSTQLQRLCRRLRAAGTEVVATREPGATPTGRRLREILLRASATPPSPTAELLLYLADRADHLERVVLPALGRGALVLCDRYRDATLAYQGHGRGIPLARIRRLHADPPLDTTPDRTLLFDLDPGIGLERARERDRRNGKAGAEDRFEHEALAFHQRVRQGYLALAAESPERFRVIDAAGDPDEVERRVIEAVADCVPAGRDLT